MTGYSRKGKAESATASPMVWAETENKVLVVSIVPVWSNNVNRCVTEILIWRDGYF
jgi:hypothetical protein